MTNWCVTYSYVFIFCESEAVVDKLAVLEIEADKGLYRYCPCNYVGLLFEPNSYYGNSKRLVLVYCLSLIVTMVTAKGLSGN